MLKLKKINFAVAVAFCLCVGIAAFYTTKKKVTFEKINCILHGHDWQRVYSDNWQWEYNTQAKDLHHPYGYKYRLKQDYVLCQRCRSYLFNNAVVDADIIALEPSENNPPASKGLVRINSATNYLSKLIAQKPSWKKKQGKLKVYTQGILSRVIAFKKGVPDGVCFIYYPGGSLRQIWTYSSGKLNGPCIEFFHKDKLRGQWVCRMDRMEGDATFHHPNTVLRLVAPYHKDVLDGEVKEFYETGVLKRTDTLSRGVHQGVSRLYYPDGTLRWERNFCSGRRCGITTEYDASGRLFRQGFFRRGKGVVKEFGSDGRVTAIMDVDNGRMTTRKSAE